MFRALTCPSSGGKIVFAQHLVSSLSVKVCTVHWLRADSFTIILDMFRALTCPSSGGKIVFTQHLVSSLSVVTNILLVNKENCALKLVDEIILYYDARSKKHKKIYILYIKYFTYFKTNSFTHNSVLFVNFVAVRLLKTLFNSF